MKKQPIKQSSRTTAPVAKQISTLSPDQKSYIHSTAILTSFAYGVWGHSLKDDMAIMSKELIDNRIAKYPYISPTELAQKVTEHDPELPIRYIIDIPTEEVEEAYLPDLAQLGKEGEEVKVSHFWGNTGFRPGSPYPSDNPAINEAELKKTANSYMGSVILVEDKKNPKNSQLFITFRGSRGGTISYESITNAKSGKGNPDWVTDLDMGKYFHFVRSGLSTVKDAFRALTPAEKRSKIYNHEGICKTYHSCKPGIEAAVKELGIGNLSSFPGKITITGHSLGGGLATMCAYDLRGGLSGLDNVTFRHYTSRLVPEAKKTQQTLYVADPEKISCVSYSAPAVGNDKFAKDFKKLVPNNMRVVIDSDPITIELSKTYNLKHVHGKVDLGEMSQGLEKKETKKILPEHLKFGFLPSGRAHQIPKVMELAHIVTDNKYVPLIRTVPKNDIGKQREIKNIIKSLTKEISGDPQAKKYMDLLTELQELNYQVIHFCIKSYYDDNPQEYLDYLKRMLSICEKIQKKMPRSSAKNSLDKYVENEIAKINNDIKGLLEIFSPKSVSTVSSTDSESGSTSLDDEFLLVSKDSFTTVSESESVSFSEGRSSSPDENGVKDSVTALTSVPWLSIYPKTKVPSVEKMADKNSPLFSLE